MANISPRYDKEGNLISYQIRVYRGRDVNNKQLKPFTMTWQPPEGWGRKSIEKELNRIASLFEDNCLKGNVSTEKLSFEKYANYVITLKDRNGAKHRTISRYKSLLERIVDVNCEGIGHIKLQDLRPDHLNTFYTKLSEKGQNKKTGQGLGPKTIIEHHRLISTILAQAVKEQLIPQNIAERATPPQMPKHEADCFELEEIFTIIDALENEPLKWKLIGHLFISTGARRGEIAGIKWASVDFKSNQIYLCNNLLYSSEKGVYNDSLKNNETRYVSVAPAVMGLLREYKAEQKKQQLMMGSEWHNLDYVFCQYNGQPLFPDSITNWFSKFEKRNNLPHINPHKFRHSQASILISQGVDIVTVSKRLGHAKVSTTSDIYAHLVNRANDKATSVISTILYNKAQ